MFSGVGRPEGRPVLTFGGVGRGDGFREWLSLRIKSRITEKGKFKELTNIWRFMETGVPCRNPSSTGPTCQAGKLRQEKGLVQLTQIPAHGWINHLPRKKWLRKMVALISWWSFGVCNPVRLEGSRTHTPMLTWCVLCCTVFFHPATLVWAFPLIYTTLEPDFPGNVSRQEGSWCHSPGWFLLMRVWSAERQLPVDEMH